MLLGLLALGTIACSGERSPQATVQLPFTLAPPTPNEVVLPRFTPHVTSPKPTPLPPTATPISAPPTPQPQPMLPTPAPSPVRIYVVQPYETLYDIATKLHVSLEALARANRITDPTTIQPGDKLIIP